MHVGVDDQTHGVEGVPEDAEDRQVPGPRRGLVRHEDEDGLAFALDEVKLRHPRPHTLDVAGEGVGQHVLPGPIELHLLGQGGEFHEGVPGESVHLGIVFAPLVGHDELGIITHVEHLAVHQEASIHRLLHDLPGQRHHVRMAGAVAHPATHISLNYR